MADDDEVLVQVEGEADTDGETNLDPAAELQRQFEALKAENKKRADSEAAANRRAADERAAADAARREAAEAKANVADSQLDGVVSRIAAAQAEAEAAEKDYAAAAEAGDFKKQAEAQRRMARAESRATTLESEKAYIEARKSSPERSEPPSRVASDPFEDHVSKFTERTAQWMRDHRDWIVDPKKNAKVTGAHNFAVSEGLTPDTDDYFEFVEKMIGLRQDQSARNGAGNGQQQNRAPARRVTPMVAPVNGGAGGHSSGSGDNRETVKLSQGEARMAREVLRWNKGERDAKGDVLKDGDPRIGQPIGVTEYYRRKEKMRKDGYYDRSYGEG